MFWILAGNYHEARVWAQTRGLQEKVKWKYLQSAQDLTGFKNPDIARVGTWYKRKDLDQILDMIEVVTIEQRKGLG